MTDTTALQPSEENKLSFPPHLFKAVADACVPPLRDSLKALGFSEDDVSPSIGMTAAVDIDGKVSRVRVTCTLAPEDGQ